MLLRRRRVLLVGLRGLVLFGGRLRWPPAAFGSLPLLLLALARRGSAPRVLLGRRAGLLLLLLLLLRLTVLGLRRPVLRLGRPVLVRGGTVLAAVLRLWRAGRRSGRPRGAGRLVLALPVLLLRLL
ncbi:hypothetical protein [Actinomadura rugatobispora]|uniref:Uncharacterized protein n=1 Tax=Actinomadura rugatobispora TaxID=1994 RepID=A0ABW1AIV7_9ACTN|nr:hypothetical protein GCM10010200_061720 [Actinomadura rugatobispora]